MRKFVLFALCLLLHHPVSAETTSESESMDFDTCVKSIQILSTELGIAPVNIVETPALHMTKFWTSDGSVLVTCNRAERKRIITVEKK